MKKKILFVILFFVILFLCFLSWLIYISFAKVKPATNAVNEKLTALVFSKVVRIPEGIPHPMRDFDKIEYLWEMETRDKEVSTVHFKYNPAYLLTEKEIVATLEMNEGGDPSVFDKVLPAIISNDISLASAQDPKKANLSQNSQAYYKSLSLQQDPKNIKTVKISWTYQKEDLPQEIQQDYKKLNYPSSILKILYSIPNFLTDLARG